MKEDDDGFAVSPRESKVKRFGWERIEAMKIKTLERENKLKEKLREFDFGEELKKMVDTK